MFNPLSLASHPSRPTLGPDLMPDGGPLRQAAENRPWELVNVLNWSEGREREGGRAGPREAHVSLTVLRWSLKCVRVVCAPES